MSSLGHGQIAIWHCMQRPALSPDGCLLAVLTSHPEIVVWSLQATRQDRVVATTIKWHRQYHAFLQSVVSIEWAPETILEEPDNDVVAPDRPANASWLLLASNQRVLTLRIKIPSDHNTVQDEEQTKADILADYTYPEYFGKIKIVRFVFNHDTALILFDIFDCAILQSFNTTQRDDIPSRKFAAAQGYAISASGRRLALLVKDQQKDRVVVFENNRLISSFDACTANAQGVRWSPDCTPLLAIWDSAAVGTRVNFYTATGQGLRMLDVGPSRMHSDVGVGAMTGPGVSSIAWTGQRGHTSRTILSIGDGSKQVVSRCQDMRTLGPTETFFGVHTSTIIPTETMIWRELESGSFEQENGLWNAAADQHADVGILANNADGQLLATTLSSQPNVLYVWQTRVSKPVNVINFQSKVRQTLWHPTLDGVLAVFTANESPIIYLWTAQDMAPVRSRSLVQADSAGRWEGQWVNQMHNGESATLFMLCSKEQYDIGHLGLRQNEVMFRSMLLQEQEEHSDIFGTIDTPSRKAVHGRPDNDNDEHQKGTVWLSDARLG